MRDYKYIMLSKAFLAALYRNDNRLAEQNHHNFKGANIYRVRGGLFSVVGHHHGEAQKTVDWLESRKAEMAA